MYYIGTNHEIETMREMCNVKCMRADGNNERNAILMTCKQIRGENGRDEEQRRETDVTS